MRGEGERDIEKPCYGMSVAMRYGFVVVSDGCVLFSFMERSEYADCTEVMGR